MTAARPAYAANAAQAPATLAAATVEGERQFALASLSWRHDVALPGILYGDPGLRLTSCNATLMKHSPATM